MRLSTRATIITYWFVNNMVKRVLELITWKLKSFLEEEWSEWRVEKRWGNLTEDLNIRAEKRMPWVGKVRWNAYPYNRGVEVKRKKGLSTFLLKPRAVVIYETQKWKNLNESWRYSLSDECMINRLGKGVILRNAVQNEKELINDSKIITFKWISERSTK